MSDSESDMEEEDNSSDPMEHDDEIEEAVHIEDDIGKQRDFAVPSHLWNLQAKRAIPLSKTKYLNDLIMDYLIIQGEELAARTFVNESGITPIVDLDTIEARQTVRRNILEGKCSVAIEKINELDINILNSKEKGLKLLFKLKKQILIEMIRDKNINGALDYVQSDIEPIMKSMPNLIEKMEDVLLLMAFDNLDVAPKACRNLMNLKQRGYIANEVNSIILNYFNQTTINQITMIEKERKWIENKLLDWETSGIPYVNNNTKNSNNSERNSPSV